MLRIRLKRSVIGSVPRNRRTVAALGLRKLNQVVEKPDTPAIRGMIHNVQHLVEVEQSGEATKPAAAKKEAAKKPKAEAAATKAKPKAKKAPAKKPASKKSEEKE